MSIVLLIIKFWREVLILFLFMLTILFASVSSIFIAKYNGSKASCDVRVSDIHASYAKAQEKANIQAYDASVDYEHKKTELKETQNVVYKTVEKIIERPIYLNVCLDDDGLSEINSSIKAYDPS